MYGQSAVCELRRIVALWGGGGAVSDWYATHTHVGFVVKWRSGDGRLLPDVSPRPLVAQISCRADNGWCSGRQGEPSDHPHPPPRNARVARRSRTILVVVPFGAAARARWLGARRINLLLSPNRPRNGLWRTGRSAVRFRLSGFRGRCHIHLASGAIAVRKKKNVSSRPPAATKLSAQPGSTDSRHGKRPLTHLSGRMQWPDVCMPHFPTGRADSSASARPGQAGLRPFFRLTGSPRQSLTVVSCR